MLFSAECVFNERRSFSRQMSARQMLHPEHRRAGAVVSLVLLAPRRHCLEALYKTPRQVGDASGGYHQGHANNERHEEFARGEQKHLLEENWQEELALIEQSRNASLPEHENEQKMSHCRVWRTRWHRARDVGAISAKGSQSGDGKIAR